MGLAWSESGAEAEDGERVGVESVSDGVLGVLSGGSEGRSAGVPGVPGVPGVAVTGPSFLRARKTKENSQGSAQICLPKSSLKFHRASTPHTLLTRNTKLDKPAIRKR